ncbi:MAG TPA: acylphosphatase [Nitrospira sp.]|uniref:acylphosphatase n=1 Tax=Nitrospira sp. BLG_1 TaxID=3395883 RepID=UPI000E876512|nr:acylphosphatase [Nitrospira sp.]
MNPPADELSVWARVLVHGRVQGVGFRAFAARVASDLRLFGGVRNLSDGRVELEVEGQKAGIEMLERQLRIGPAAARVMKIETEWGAATGRYSGFEIWY